jgi:eukaryotic-like serine/threonine-protein kinase
VDGRYRVEEQLGEGSMGIVVAASDLLQGGRVAMKYPHAHAGGSSEFAARLRWELQAVQRIRSPHVVRATGAGTLPSGVPYFVMERLEGDDLSQVLARRTDPLPVREALLYILQASEGLIDTHAAGIVHRDIKPANLFLAARTDGTPLVKLLDFGISLGIRHGCAASDRPDSSLESLGSPAYISPEQIDSFDDVDARADIWSVGAVLYRLLTGQHVHEENSLGTLLAKTRTCPAPSAQTVRPDLPCGLSDVISRCLEREPHRRIQTAAELIHALRPFSGE